ncbi:MAG: YcgL domain-containing protein [Xanthomonadales bacterium]|nr:YcgL domain-containing protein [Gammaproteobacteria bacterium]MBT8053482.1 YcgL domain-containing protein [Gammaproteobacteria bacterium]NND55850.1 YcgL domain-containing protein [Xanthomonadales bacterium]NNK50930.1 YcgL domain-containing protein [Xanthomonadales bacterium]
MLCTIYRSEKRSETYLYLAQNLDFQDLPDDLRDHFGEPVLVMRLKLARARKLARADVDKVMSCLEDQGFYLQLPPQLPVEEEIARRFS